MNRTPIGTRIEKGALDALGSDANKLTDAERQAIARVTEMAARLGLRAAAGLPVDPADLRHLRAQLSNVSSISASIVTRAVISATRGVFLAASRLLIA